MRLNLIVCAPTRPLLAMLAMLVSAGATSAVTLVNSAGFEQPTFVPGAFPQDGWVTLGSDTGAPSTAVIQDAIKLSGNQALRVDRKSGSNRFWFKSINSAPSGRYISIDWDMLVEPTVSSGGLGPFLGVDVVDDSNGGVAAVAALGVDGTTGDILIREGGTGFLIETGMNATTDVWSHYRIELDFQLDQYRVFVNGSLAGTTGFADDNIIEIDRITDADIAAFAAGADLDSQLAETFAVFDNFIVRDGLRGDYNDDGLVDVSDYTLWRDQLGQTGWELSADGNADGVVDVDDYQLWREEFGLSNGIILPLTAAPEPGSLCLVAAVAGLAAGSRKRL